MNEKYCLITNDVETTSIFHNCLSDKAGEKVLKDGMPILLDLYERYKIKSTFFITGYMAKKFPEIVKMITPYGHEVGCHGYSHAIHDAFDTLNFEKQVEHLTRAKQILEDISSNEVVSFRAPALRINKYTHHALITAGFKIDSSIASQRFDFFLSFGGGKKLKWLITPRHPYLTKENDLHKKGKSSIVEVPLSALILPYMGSTLRIMPHITRLLRSYLHMEKNLNSNPIVFVIHPNELIIENEKNRHIVRRKKNFITYIWSDYFRAKLKIRNIGPQAIPLLEHEFGFFQRKNYQFYTVKDYCKKMGLI